MLVSLSLYFERVTVFAQLLYIPIILFGYRYPQKGVLFSTIVGAIYLIAFGLLIDPHFGMYIDAVGRVVLFISVGLIVSYISGRMYFQRRKYLDLFENLSDPVFISEWSEKSKTERITDCNLVACRLLGYKKEELLNMQVLDLIAEKDRERINFDEDNRGCRTPKVFETLVRYRGGREVPFKLRIYTCGMGNDIFRLVVARNIEERLKAKDRIIEERRRLEESRRLTHIGYWELDRKTGTVTFSEEAFRILGISPSSGMNMDIEDYYRRIHPDFQEKFKESYESSVQNTRDFSVRYKVRGEGGKEKWIHTRGHHFTDKDGKIVRTVGTFIDITKDIESEIKIAEQAHFFETMLETIPLPVFYKSREGVYLGCNQAFANLSGMKKSQIIGKHAEDIFDEKTAAAQHERDVLVLRMSGIQIYESEFTIKNKSPRIMIVSKAAIRDKNNRPDIIIGVMQDITDIKKTKENLKKSLEEKNVLLQEVHHRVKNNLASISGILEIEKSRVKDPEALIFLDEAEGRIQSMVVVHESLYHSENVGEIDAEEHFRNLFESVLTSYSPSAVLTPDIDTSGCEIDINSAIPCSLVANEILTNSMKYAFNDRSEGKITIKLECTGDNYILVIADDGCGIPEDFDPENTSSLGMKVIYNIVRLQLMGTVSLERENGTRWTIEWPKRYKK